MILGLALLQVLFLLADGSRAPGSGEDMDLVDIFRALNFPTGQSSTTTKRPTGIDIFAKDKLEIGDGALGEYNGKICFKNHPFCFSISGTTKIEESEDPKENPVLKSDKTNRDEVCYADFEVRNCEDQVFNSKNKKIDFNNVKIKDFCAPGTLELEGTLSVGIPVTSSHTVYAAFKNSKGVHFDEHRSLKPCPGWDYCTLKDVDEVLQWNEKCKDRDEESIPCQTPVRKGTYTLDDVKANVPADPFENSTLTNGLIFGRVIIYIDNGPLSCAFVTFRRFTRHFRLDNVLR